MRSFLPMLVIWEDLGKMDASPAKPIDSYDDLVQALRRLSRQFLHRSRVPFGNLTGWGKIFAERFLGRVLSLPRRVLKTLSL